MALFDMTEGTIVAVPPGHFGANDATRRDRLRTALRENIGVLGEDLLVIAEEFGEDDATGGVDILCIDRTARLVVVELNRSGLSGAMELHALRLAAAAVGMSRGEAEAHLATQLAKEGRDERDAGKVLEEWLIDVESDKKETFRDVRLILVYGRFAPESTATATWLRETFGMDIRCVRITPYRFGERILLEIERVVPLPTTDHIVLRPEQDAPKPRFRTRPSIIVALVLVGLIAASLALRSYVTSSFEVPSDSMTPTLQVGDRLFVNKAFSTIHRGDIVVFSRAPGDSDTTYADLVKRVVGLPGETISSSGDTILINGRPIPQPWLPALQGVCRQSDAAIATTTIQPGQYFVMGDCRGDSADSRMWGTVPTTNIIGKVDLVAWRHNHPWFHWF